MHEHTRARREVLQVMYQNELTGTPVSDLAADSGETSMLLIPVRPKGVEDNDLIGEPLAEYASALLEGIVSKLDEIDGWISDVAENWTLDRMPIVDRNIIRIAVYEVAFCDDIPTGVAINEAVEIAKAFGGDESPKFVNGVLGRIARSLDQDVELDEEIVDALSGQADVDDEQEVSFEKESEKAEG